MNSASGFSRSRMSVSSGHVGPMVVPMKVAMPQTLSRFKKAGSVVISILNGGVDAGIIKLSLYIAHNVQVIVYCVLHTFSP